MIIDILPLPYEIRCHIRYWFYITEFNKLEKYKLRLLFNIDYEMFERCYDFARLNVDDMLKEYADEFLRINNRHNKYFPDVIFPRKYSMACDASTIRMINKQMEYMLKNSFKLVIPKMMGISEYKEKYHLKYVDFEKYML